MLMQLATLAGALFVGLVVIALVFVLGMRAKSPLVLRPLIRLQRAIINPRQMRSAGTPGAYASVIRHRGRVSGRSYETPVGAVAVDDGFVIALVYGSRTNWLQNVLAAGPPPSSTKGRTYAVDQPEIVPMQVVQAHFTAGDQRGFRWLGVDQALRVRRVEPSRSTGADAGHLVDDQRDDRQRALTACDLDLPLRGRRTEPGPLPCRAAHEELSGAGQGPGAPRR